MMRKHQRHKRSCDGCKWYHDWFGVCTNNDAPDPGGTPDERCELYERVKEPEDNDI